MATLFYLSFYLFSSLHLSLCPSLTFSMKRKREKESKMQRGKMFRYLIWFHSIRICDLKIDKAFFLSFTILFFYSILFLQFDSFIHLFHSYNLSFFLSYFLSFYQPIVIFFLSFFLSFFLWVSYSSTRPIRRQ